MEFENITMIMMELYYQLKENKIDEKVAEHFIVKLDDIKNNIVYSKFFPNVQNISDAVTSETNYINLGYGKNDSKHTYITDNERGRIVRDTFFTKNKNGDVEYLGKYVELSPITKTRLLTFIECGLTSPQLFDYDHSVKFLDRKRFADLSEQGLIEYKKYIDKLISCYASMFTTKNPQLAEQKINEITLNWRKRMVNNLLDYRITAYDKACELEKTSKDNFDEERE